jgi:transposase
VTKIHGIVDALGNPLWALSLTGGQRSHDITVAAAGGPGQARRSPLGDKGYDTDSFITSLEGVRAIKAVILTRSTRQDHQRLRLRTLTPSARSRRAIQCHQALSRYRDTLMKTARNFLPDYIWSCALAWLK